MRYTVLGTRKDRYKTKCAIRYLAQGRIGTRPSALYGTWHKEGDQVRYTVLGIRKGRYKIKCAIRYLAQGRIGTRPSALSGTWHKEG